MNIRTSLPLSAIAASALLWAGSSGAAVISQDFSFGPPSVSFAESMASPVFNLFDPALGTLDSITIALDATITGITTLRRQNATGGDITPGGGVTRALTLDLSSIELGNLAIFDNDPWELLLPAGTPPESVQTQFVDTLVSSDLTTSSADVLAKLIGLGTVSFGLDGLITDGLTGSAFKVRTLTAAAVGDITLTYNFTPIQNGNIQNVSRAALTPVAEPAVLVLLGLGLLGVGALRRRRQED